MIKDIIKRIIPSPILSFIKTNGIYQNYKNYKASFAIKPPSEIVKQEIVAGYAKENGIEIFVETGTNHGNMVQAIKVVVEKVVSIELGQDLASKATKRFENDSHIKIIQGASEDKLYGILQDIKKPILFWLDAHYSGGNTAKGDLFTPIVQELEIIGTHAKLHNLHHIVLIDDARLFGKRKDYPKIRRMRELTRKLFPGRRFTIDDDIIRID